jgi:uncharacterized oxidoreductase
MAEYVTVMPDALRATVRAVCRAGGSNEREAALVAENLVLANLSGHDSHGVGMLPQYWLAVHEKRLIVNQSNKIAVDAGAMVTIDGGMGYGQVVGHEAMELAILRAKLHGVCVMAIRNSHHIGRIGHWGEQCASAGMISTHYVNVVNRQPLVAPFGGSDARFATNPYCCAIPGPNGGEPIVLDMATSTIAMGKVRVAMNKGESVPPGILIDAKGAPSTDPTVMFNTPIGAIRAFGEHKGYGLALIAELLSGPMSGGGTGRNRWEVNTITNNMLSIVFDPSKLGGADTWQDEVEAYVKFVKASPPAPDNKTGGVLVAGEPERRTRAERNQAGIPVDITTWNEIVAAAEMLGHPASETRRIAGLK